MGDTPPLAMKREHFITLAEFLYGPNWKAPLSTAVHISTSHIREMASGKRRVTRRMAAHLLDSMENHKAGIGDPYKIADQAAIQLQTYLESQKE